MTDFLLEWFVQEGWTATLACLNLALVCLAVVWMKNADIRWSRIEAKYHSLADRYGGAFRALDAATREQESSSKEMRRITQEFSGQFKLDDTQQRVKNADDDLG